jgi:hypothetical protein
MNIFARVISYLFHPLFIISYVLAIIMVVNPYLFGVQDPKMMGLILISTFLLATFFPLISISMMRALGLIKSFKMEDRRDRIGPLIVTAIFYLWLFLNIKDNPGIPAAFSFFVLGAIIGLFIAFFINNFQKISLHGVAIGGFLVGIAIIGIVFSYGSFVIDIPSLGSFTIDITLIYILALLIAGLVLSSRLQLKAHSKDEVYGGFFVGAISQILAFIIFI